jgi:hypothetical protein
MLETDRTVQEVKGLEDEQLKDNCYQRVLIDESGSERQL